MAKARKLPGDVFTPRSAIINDQMYVHRPELEFELQAAIRGSLHILIHGHSGCGKSWLYKKVLKDAGVYYVTANFANASRLGGLAGMLKNIVDRECEAQKTGYSEAKGAEIGMPLLKAGVKHTGEYTIGSKEPLEACFEFAREKAKDKLACLVLENLEQSNGNESLIKEVADMLILLDDEHYAAYKVKVILVGTPNSASQYFASIKNRASVSNRIYEISEVSRLTDMQAADLVRKGLVEELKMQVGEDELYDITREICRLTERVPQRLHEYCLELSRLGQVAGNTISYDMIPYANAKWLNRSFSADRVQIESLMNKDSTSVGRRNQCLYALGVLYQEEFRSADVEEVIRKEFSIASEKTDLKVGKMLAQIADAPEPIIDRSLKGDAYTFKDPKYRMCIRAMLRKNPDGTVSKNDLGTM